jgi:hypothetical protein
MALGYSDSKDVKNLIQWEKRQTLKTVSLLRRIWGKLVHPLPYFWATAGKQFRMHVRSGWGSDDLLIL